MTTRYGVKDEIPTPTNLVAMFGAHVTTLDATPTGSAAAFDVVADFTGGTNLIAGDSSNTLPVAITNSQTDGTTLKINTPGRYLVMASVPIVGAVTVNAALGLDNPAGELNTDPPAALSGTILARSAAVGVAALQMPLFLVGEAKISKVMADTSTLGLIRLLLGNGAGTGPAAAAFSLANVYLKVERVGIYEEP